MSYPLFVPNTKLRIQEEALDRYGCELADWVLDLVKDELGWVCPMVEIETMRRVIDHHLGSSDQKKVG